MVPLRPVGVPAGGLTSVGLRRWFSVTGVVACRLRAPPVLHSLLLQPCELRFGRWCCLSGRRRRQPLCRPLSPSASLSPAPSLPSAPSLPVQLSLSASHSLSVPAVSWRENRDGGRLLGRRPVWLDADEDEKEMGWGSWEEGVVRNNSRLGVEEELWATVLYRFCSLILESSNCYNMFLSLICFLNREKSTRWGLWGFIHSGLLVLKS